MREAWGTVRLSLLGIGAFSGAHPPQAADDREAPADYHPPPLEARHACDGAASGAEQGGGGEGGEQGLPSSEGASIALPGGSGVSPRRQAEGGAAPPRLSATSAGVAVLSPDFKLNLHAAPPPPPDLTPGPVTLTGERWGIEARVG